MLMEALLSLVFQLIPLVLASLIVHDLLKWIEKDE